MCDQTIKNLSHSRDDNRTVTWMCTVQRLRRQRQGEIVDHLCFGHTKRFAHLVVCACSAISALRRADDGGKVDGLAVKDLSHWVAVLGQLSVQR